MNDSFASTVQRWLGRIVLVAAAVGGSAQAAVYRGVWDPAYGAPFTNLGWRGTADYFVPDTCLPGGTVDLDNTYDCAGAAIVTSAEVEFYDVNAGGQPTLATLVFDPQSLIIGTLRFVSGELTQLTTTNSNYLAPDADLSAFGVSWNTEFSLLFTLDGPRLAWRECYYSDYHYSTHHYPPKCASGLNDNQQFPATFTITQVPEPGTLALAALALLVLAPRRVRAALVARRT
ncbi:MAG: PEP-CTERM sorting domain-containing protein [Rubrivivax sp.]|nr:PEP-CTERM sorting domain-containing protein [Rubrivivax sp.]